MLQPGHSTSTNCLVLGKVVALVPVYCNHLSLRSFRLLVDSGF